MLGAQRKDHLREILRTDGRVVAKDVASALGVSEDSIRRDLRELAEAGELVRVYGGALPIAPADRPVDQRSSLAHALGVRPCVSAQRKHRKTLPRSVLGIPGGVRYQGGALTYR